MFESKIDFYNGELEKTENIANQLKTNIKQLGEKREIMSKYLEFINVKGFGYIKQTTDDHFKNMKESNTERVEAPKYCGMPYIFMNKEWDCMKPEGHLGECGVV